MSNKTLIFLVLFVGALVAIDSCKPKNSDAVTPTDSLAVDSTLSSPCLVLSEKINNTLFRQYEYDTLNRLVRMVEYSGSQSANRMIKRYTFLYNNKGNLNQFNETNLAERDKSYIYDVDYDESGMVSALRKFKVYNSGPRNTDSLAVVYDDKKRVIELQSLADGSYKWEYDSLGNAKNWLFRSATMTQDSVLAIYSSYDTQTNLYAFSKGIQLVDLLNGRAPSSRNLLAYRTGNRNYTTTYQYNAKKVPTQATRKSKATGGLDTTQVETVFMYELRCK